ncbi:MAG: cation/multidrug efflux pump [Gammaproteobacteria bacterium]
MNALMTLPAGAGLAAALLLLIGVLFFIIALIRLRRLQLLAASGHGLFSLALLGIGLALAGLGLNLHTYQRLTDERMVAELEFRQLGPQQFQVRILYPQQQRYQDFTLNGDEWQLDARVLKWHGPAILAGLDSQFRLERLSGRYTDIHAEKHLPRSVEALSDNPGLDLWALVRRHEQRLPWVDAYYGSATYLPMHHGAQYRVQITQTGLIARPINAAGQQSLENWY